MLVIFPVHSFFAFPSSFFFRPRAGTRFPVGSDQKTRKRDRSDITSIIVYFSLLRTVCFWKEIKRENLWLYCIWFSFWNDNRGGGPLVKTVSLHSQAGLRSVRFSSCSDLWIISRVIFDCFSGMDLTGRRLGGHTPIGVLVPKRGVPIVQKKLQKKTTLVVL